VALICVLCEALRGKDKHGIIATHLDARREIDVLRGPETKTYAASNVARPEDPRLIQL